MFHKIVQAATLRPIVGVFLQIAQPRVIFLPNYDFYDLHAVTCHPIKNDRFILVDISTHA